MSDEDIINKLINRKMYNIVIYVIQVSIVSDSYKWTITMNNYNNIMYKMGDEKLSMSKLYE
jgi:hypothetical protein